MDPRPNKAELIQKLILEQFELRGEDVYRRSTGKLVDPKPNKLGYKRVTVASGRRGGFHVWFHRLKFFLAKGFMPDFVDHQDIDPSNNQTANLRSATRQQNMLNRKQPSKRTLPRGVYKSKRGRGFYAAATLHKKRHHLGYHPTVEQAQSAVETFRLEHHGEFYANPKGG